MFFISKTYDKVSASGMYYIKYFNCPGSGVGTVTINGDISWMNPFGHLSAELYPFLWVCFSFFFCFLFY